MSWTSVYKGIIRLWSIKVFRTLDLTHQQTTLGLQSIETMCSLIAFISLLIVASVSSNADPQYGYNSNFNNPFQNYGGIQNGFPQPSFETPKEDPFSQQAQFRALFTFTFATTTSTSTFTSYTTCTTSTAAIKTCSPSGRRRRGMILSGDRKGRGLFFNEKDQEKEDSIFLPQPKT